MTTVATPLSHAARRADRLAGLALLVTAVLVGVLLHTWPLLVGTYVDDGIYLATGKALAEGRGYCHIELPGEPYQTKYPILYPALVSLVWRAFPEFPQNVVPLRWINVGLWTAGSWLAYCVLRRAWGLPAWLATAAVLLAFLGAATLSVLESAMSEPLYFALSMAALSLATRWTADPPVPAVGPDRAPRESRTAVARRRLPTSAALGALIAAAYLTRSIALALAAALVLTLVMRRRWLALLGVVFGGSAATVGWQTWRAWARGVNAANPAVAALRYDLDYTAWFAGGDSFWTAVRTHLWIAWQNTTDVLFSLLLTLVQIGADPLEQRLRMGPSHATAVYVAMGVCAVLVLIGAVVTWTRRSPAAHLYAAAYLALVLIWPFEPQRFLLVLSPLFFGWLLAGIYAIPAALLGSGLKTGATSGAASGGNVISSVESRLARLARRSDIDAAQLITALVCGLLGLLEIAPLLSNNVQRAAAARLVAEREAVAALIRAQTPPDAVVSGLWGGFLHLRSGRKVVPPLPGDAQIRLYYPPDRPIWGCGRGGTRAMLAAQADFTRTRLLDFLRATGAGYVVPMRTDERPTYAEPFAELVRQHPTWLIRIGQVTPAAAGQPVYELYKVTLP